MRILMLSWEYPPHVVGGLGKHVAELVPALAQTATDIHLVTPATDQASVERNEGFTVHRVPSPPSTAGDFYQQAVDTNRILYEACAAIQQHDGPFDLIHNHDWLTSFAAIQYKNT